MTAAEGLDFSVKRDDWRECRFDPVAEPGELEPGRVLFRVDRFAFTANNISYAKTGELLRYWDFFPAREGWGRIPTMGFGDVIRSTHPDVAEGTRAFGFFPMSRYLVIEPSHATPATIFDGAAHREGIAAALCGVSALSWVIVERWQWRDEIMTWCSVVVLAFVIGCTVLFARQREAAAGD